MELIPVPMNAARICDAIARIGYRPASALMDIVDNSVAAGATQVDIHIEVVEGTTLAQKGNVLEYRVVDNGRGMSNDQMVNALKLGSDAKYPDGSLSKYGLGLKSAGLSLGRRIDVRSKQAGVVGEKHVVDRDIIEQQSAYLVGKEPLTPEEMQRLDTDVPGASGTVVTILQCDKVVQESARKTYDFLVEKLGVTYYEYLTADPPLSIRIHLSRKAPFSVVPTDILALKDALPAFDKDSYDGKLPVRVFDREIAFTDGTADQKAKMTVVLFPKHEMSRYAGFDEETQKRIEGYKIKRENSGFFIYRNRRLIRWGDHLGMGFRDDIGFRARISLTTGHDDLLHVDVSKQRLLLPDNILQDLNNAIRVPHKQAKELFEKCTEITEKQQDEGSDFNTRNSDVAETDPAALTSPPTPETKDRRKRLAEKTRKQLENVGEQGGGADRDATSAFEKVRYSNRVAGNVLWEAGFDDVEGGFVRVNRNHPYYSLVLSNLPAGGAPRQALEALIWACSAAESTTLSNLTTLPPETIELVLKRYKSILGNTLEVWCGSNEDLFPSR